jgi:chromosome segregation protein
LRSVLEQLEQQLSKAKQTQTEYEDKLYQAYRYTDKMRARIESLEIYHFCNSTMNTL